MSQRMIAYGAGKYGKLYLPELKKRGLEPICFVDQDPEKMNTQFYGYDVKSLAEAETLAGEKLDVYLTLSSLHLLSATEYLLQQGIEKERIKYLEDVEYRYGCQHLNTWLIYGEGCMQPCNHWKYSEKDKVMSSGDPAVDYIAYTKKVNQLIDDLRNNRKCTCNGCFNLKYGIYPTSFKPKSLSLYGSVKGEWCNSRCVYCNLTKTTKDNIHVDGLDVMKMLEGFAPYFGENSLLYYIPAEITISPFRTQIYNFMLEHHWDFTIIKTNGIKYDSQLIQFCSHETKINVSLDSGTKETYAKVKGVNAFDKVIENIKKYRSEGAGIELKYILLENLNDDERDMDGFLSIAKELADKIILTVDMNTLKSGISSDLWERLEIFSKKIVKSQIPVGLHSEHLSNESLERLSKLLCLT